MKLGFGLSGWRTALLSSYIDNIVYRHEIGMNAYGRLRKGSPVIAAHMVMLAFLLLVGALYLVGRWEGVLYASGSEILLLTLATYPIAYRRGFLSLWRERVAGTLEQLYLTPLTHRQLFEGKYFGAMAPFLEVRRYLMLLNILFCVSVFFSVPGSAIWLGAAALCLTATNHFGYSASMGVIAGLRTGSRSTKMAFAFFKDWDLNPWNHHLILITKYLLFLLIPILFLYYLLGDNLLVYALMMLIPLNGAYELYNRERLERDKLSRRFKTVFSFEPST